MNNKQKLTRKIIEAIHGKHGVIKLDNDTIKNAKSNPTMALTTITLSRVLQALNTKTDYGYAVSSHGRILKCGSLQEEIDGMIQDAYTEMSTTLGTGRLTWKLLKPSGQTATIDDQTDETIDKLLELLN